MRKQNNVFLNDSPECATDTCGNVLWEIEQFRVFGDFLIVFSLYSENGVSIPYAVYGIRSQAHVAVLG